MSNVLLEPARLTDSGRPILSSSQEVERFLYEGVEIQFHDQGGISGQMSQKYTPGHMVLTTRNLVWIDAAAAPQPGRSCLLPLPAIRSAALRASHMLAQSKLCLKVSVDWQGRPQQDGPLSIEVKLVTKHLQPLHDELQRSLTQAQWQRRVDSSARYPAINQGSAMAAVQGGTFSPLSDAVESQAHHQIVQELQSMGFPRDRASRAAIAVSNAGTGEAVNWLMEHDAGASICDGPSAHPLTSLDDEDVNASGNLPQEQYFSARAAGVAGILRREQQQAATTDRTMEQAFADLRGLMALAGDMVQLAERFREALAERARAGEGPLEDHMDASMEAELINMGIASPVTKATSGALYHKELSRQLADFLAPRINKAGGMMPLPDVYCLFNRARGAELISPDDLLTAAKLLPAIGAQLTFRQFASGVLVVQSAAHSDEKMHQRLQELTGSSGLGKSLTASDVAAALSVPLAIASEHLLAAESHGALCRDDGPEGLRFYRNFFADDWMPHLLAV